MRDNLGGRYSSLLQVATTAYCKRNKQCPSGDIRTVIKYYEVKLFVDTEAEV
jgi:hypothetical protein